MLAAWCHVVYNAKDTLVAFLRIFVKFLFWAKRKRVEFVSWASGQRFHPLKKPKTWNMKKNQFTSNFVTWRLRWVNWQIIKFFLEKKNEAGQKYVLPRCSLHWLHISRHFNTTTKRLSLEDMFRILQYPSSAQGCPQIYWTIYKADNKEVLIINCRNNS